MLEKRNTKQIIKDVLHNMMKKDVEGIKESIIRNDVISFDVYDTLVSRRCGSPNKVFSLVQNEIKNSNIDFISMRSNAERIARKNSKYEEITLEEIYGYISQNNNELMKLELSIEKTNAYRNNKGFELFSFAKKMGKEIFIISDMYLPYDFITDILFMCGYNGYKKLYVSSCARVKKKTGNLFDKVLEENLIDKKKMLHIGDNPISDGISPALKGLHSTIL